MKILFQGDSITDAGRNADCGSQVSIGQGYALMISGELGAKYPGLYTFENRGISGDRIVDIYSRIKVDMWNLKPDLVSILIGVNDVWHEVDNRNGVDARRFENVYRMLIEDTLQALPNGKLMLMEPFVLKGSETVQHWEAFHTGVAERAEIVHRLAREYSLFFVPLQRKLDNACLNYDPSYWLPDGVHPSPAGHRLIADAWLDVFFNEVKDH